MSTTDELAVIEISITTIEDLREQFQQTKGWLFRGQSSSSWQLEASVVRYARRFGKEPEELEKQSFREFTRRAHLWFPFRPDRDSATEWLGWMQHYGAPTRLLDVSESPWVAAFFAVEELSQYQNEKAGLAAIWAIDRSIVEIQDPQSSKPRDRNKLLGALVDPAGFRSRGHESVFCDVFDSGRVEAMLPYLIPDRVRPQKGMFLVGFNLAEPLCGPLLQAAEKKSPNNPKAHFRKLIVPWTLRFELLGELQQMNVDAETLFPGPDGFGRSLRSLV